MDALPGDKDLLLRAEVLGCRHLFFVGAGEDWRGVLKAQAIDEVAEAVGFLSLDDVQIDEMTEPYRRHGEAGGG